MKQRYRLKRDEIIKRITKYNHDHLDHRRNKRNANKDKINAAKRLRYETIRNECLSYYSGGKLECNICHENNIQFLALDHIHGGGKKNGVKNICEWIRLNNYPEGFQVLCHNCNYVKGGINTNASSSIPYRRNAKEIVLRHYNNDLLECSCCKKKGLDFLTLDHVHNDGAAHRAHLGFQGGYKMYRWCINNNFPPLFQALCHNCNYAKWRYGVCPHQIKQ